MYFSLHGTTESPREYNLKNSELKKRKLKETQSIFCPYIMFVFHDKILGICKGSINIVIHKVIPNSIFRNIKNQVSLLEVLKLGIC